MFKKAKILSVLISSFLIGGTSNIVGAMDSPCASLGQGEFERLCYQLVCLNLNDKQRATLIQFIDSNQIPSRKTLIDKLELSEEQQIQLIKFEDENTNNITNQTELSKISGKSKFLKDFVSCYLRSDHLKKFAKNDFNNQYSLWDQFKRMIHTSKKDVYGQIQSDLSLYENTTYTKVCWNAAGALLQDINGFFSSNSDAYGIYYGYLSYPIKLSMDMANHTYCYIYFANDGVFICIDPLFNLYSISICNDNNKNGEKVKEAIINAVDNLYAKQLQYNPIGSNASAKLYTQANNLFSSTQDKARKMFDKPPAENVYVSQYIFNGKYRNNSLKNTTNWSLLPLQKYADKYFKSKSLNQVKWLTLPAFADNVSKCPTLLDDKDWANSNANPGVLFGK